MCGITGIVHLDGTSADRVILDHMTDALAHRGPDGRGIYIDRNVGLGHRRLAILDLSEAGAQPMSYANDNTIITYNGEVYNFDAERKILEAKGYSFRSRTDTEVILALYEEYGTKCLEHLRGMFAFAIYNKRKRQLFCARDRAGEKPFKYFFDGKMFLFASELKALREHPACPRVMDREAIHHFLTMMYLPSPLTGFQGIRKLPAGHFLLLDCEKGILREEQYWSLPNPHMEELTEQQWIERVRVLVEESVRFRMIADVPVGAFLSGGIDSGTIVMLMSILSKEPVHTFSIGSTIPRYNELPYADRIAGRAHTVHHPAVVEPDIARLIPTLVHLYEEPYSDPSMIPTFLVSKHASKSVKVVLSGDGGDENFAGYTRHPIALFSRFWEHCRMIHPVVRSAAKLFHYFVGNTFSYRSLRFQETMQIPWPERYLQYVSFFTEEEKRSLYNPSFAASFLPRTDTFFAARTKSCARHSDTLHQSLCMDFTTYLRDNLMPKADLASMHFGLECRAPLLDHILMETMMRVPSRILLPYGRRKSLFKKAFAHLLPREHLRRRKTGFRIPLDHRFRTDLRSLVHDRLLSDAPMKWEFFDRSALEGFVREYFASNIDFSDHIWSLLTFDEWLRQCMSAPMPSGAR